MVSPAPHACTRATASPGPGTGSGTDSSTSGVLAALITIAFIAAGFFVWYFTFQARQEERRFLIEKGYRLEELPAPPSFTFPWRKTGIVMVGSILGLILNFLTFREPQAVFPMLILGAGLGMILAQAFEKGYPVRRFWRTMLHLFTGFAIGGLGISIVYMYQELDDALTIFILLSSMALSLLIERSTRKADEPGA